MDESDGIVEDLICASGDVTSDVTVTNVRLIEVTNGDEGATRKLLLVLASVDTSLY